MLAESIIGSIKIHKGATGIIAGLNKWFKIGAEEFTTNIDITNKINPINIDPESPIKTLRFLLKLKGR